MSEKEARKKSTGADSIPAGRVKACEGGASSPLNQGFCRIRFNLTQMLCFFQDGHAGSFGFHNLVTSRNLIQ